MELTVGSAFNTTLLAALLVGVSVKVVMVNVLGSVLATFASHVGTSLGDVVPPSFTLVSKKHISTILPSEPASHAVSKESYFTLGLLMDPVSHGTFKAFSVGANFLGE